MMWSRPLLGLGLAALVAPGQAARNSYGCYTEGTLSRALNASSYIDLHGMTLETCEKFCTDKSLPLWGVEYGSECYCGRQLEVGATATFSSQCTVPCAGNAAQTCGGNAHLNLYGQSPQKPAERPMPHPEVSAIEYLGCYYEGNGTRALPGSAVADGKEMTIFACAQFCLNRGYPLFGLEYAAECYCADATTAPRLVRALEPDCSMSCSGNRDQICGGSNRLGVFQWYNPATRRPITASPTAAPVPTSMPGQTRGTPAMPVPDQPLPVVPSPGRPTPVVPAPIPGRPERPGRPGR